MEAGTLLLTEAR